MSRTGEALTDLQAGMAETLAAVNAMRESLAKLERAEAPSPSAMLTVKQVAQQLAVSTSFVADLLSAGKLRGHRIGQAWRVKQADIDAFVADCAPKPERALRLSLEGELRFQPYDEQRACISIARAARALGVGAEAVRQLASAGKLEAVRFEDGHRVTVASVAAGLRDRLARAVEFELADALTVAEAAELLGMKPGEVRSLVERGKLRAIRFDASDGTVLRDAEVRVSRRAVMERAARQRQQAAHEAPITLPAQVMPFAVRERAASAG